MFDVGILHRVKTIQSKLEEIWDTEKPATVAAKNESRSKKTRKDRGPPSGPPLVSISEDSKGNRIRTTILRYLDENGGEVIERTTEVLPEEEDPEVPEDPPEDP